MKNRAEPHTRWRPLGRILAFVLALATPLSVAVGPAAAEDPAPLFATATTSYTTNADPEVGQRFKIVGEVFLLLGESPAPLPNQTVILERRAKPTSPWVSVDTTTTRETTLPNGKKHIMYTFDQVADRTAAFRVRYAGIEAIAGSASDDGERDPVLVRVHRKMPIELLQPRPSQLVMAGSVTPLYAQQRVAVLRKTCLKCDWKSYARPMTDQDGRFRVGLTAPRQGAHYFVARARASKGFAASSSQLAKIQAG